ncbi:DUF4301 family protein [Belliella marina]|uniref:DUF4301 family protein n=1 Tax=Belliella marina TaxID=1644146 RepID=A0ABW4VM34_9BACT
MTKLAINPNPPQNQPVLEPNKLIAMVSELNQEYEKQLRYFENGIPFLPVMEPATVGNGIRRIDDPTAKRVFEVYYLKESSKLKIVYFVPSSGAATRMFKDFFAFLNEVGKKELLNVFFEQIHQFAFYRQLSATVEEAGLDLNDLIRKKDYKTILQTLLDDSSMSYGSLPKGLVKFHQYQDHERTPIHEHIYEFSSYGSGRNGEIHIHFTVNPLFKQAFVEESSSVLQFLGKDNITIGFSVQNPETDTLAVDGDNLPIHLPDGTFYRRPGGHGALIHNLNQIDADLIFLKNIDNIQIEKETKPALTYKKEMAGLLLMVRNELAQLLPQLIGSSPKKELIRYAENFLINQIGFKLPPNYMDWDMEHQQQYIFDKLNRPLRICGMVKNEGATGGGPFWVENQDGSQSLQIVETAQIDRERPVYNELFQKSTHFNPVEIVCSLRNYRGDRFDLAKYIDPDAGFISEKTKNGQKIKVFEWPGLWNGAMSDWNTLFVEIGSEHFTPVKSVYDLLDKSHQLA